MESLLLPHLVDALEHPRVQPGILDPELFGQAAPVHEIVAGLLAATLLGERDLRVWEEPAHDVRQLAETHGDPARVVERVARGVGQQHTGEDLGDVLHVNQETHEPFLDRKSTRLNSSHGYISYAVFCLKKKNPQTCPQ